MSAIADRRCSRKLLPQALKRGAEFLKVLGLDLGCDTFPHERQRLSPPRRGKRWNPRIYPIVKSIIPAND